jgi:hypothetical protein
MVTFIWKSIRRCTAYRNLAFSPTNSSRSAYQSTDTTNNRTLPHQLLKKRLSKHGYYKQPHTPGLWRHKSRRIWFNLAVDDFGIKYIGKDNLQHLYDALWKETYDIVKDHAGKLYCGINLKWN